MWLVYICMCACDKLKGKRLKSEAAEAKRPHIATEQEAKLPCAEKMVDREATLQREDPQRSSSNTEQMLAKLLAGVEVLTSKVQLIEARIGALEEVKQGKPTPAAKSGKTTPTERKSMRKESDMQNLMSFIQQAIHVSGGVQATENNWTPQEGKTRKKREKKKKKSKKEATNKAKKKVKTKESSESEAEIRTDVDQDGSDSDRAEENLETPSKKTLAALLIRDPPEKRVWTCPRLDAKSLSSGKLFVRKYEEGWSVGKIIQYRANKVRSNCEVEHETENGSKRNEMLTPDEYFSSRSENRATNGS